MSAKTRTAELSNLQFSLLLALPVLVFLLLVVAYPLGYALWMSLHQIVFFGGYKATFVGLENFIEVITDRKFQKSFWITIRFTLESVILAMVIGLLLAMALNRPMRFGGLIRTIIILPWCVSLYGTGVMFSNLAKGQTGIGTAIAYAFGADDAVNFVNRDWVIEVLAIGNAWNMAPLVAFFLLANLKTIPKRLYDLAAIDRMSRFEVFLNVTLPPLRFTLFVFTCITTGGKRRRICIRGKSIAAAANTPNIAPLAPISGDGDLRLDKIQIKPPMMPLTKYNFKNVEPPNLSSTGFPKM